MSDTIRMNVSETIKATEHMGPLKHKLTQEQQLAFQDYLRAFSVDAIIVSDEPFTVELRNNA